jgi:hypothetical protein
MSSTTILAFKPGLVLSGCATTFVIRSWCGKGNDQDFKTWRPHPRQNALQALAAAPENGVACMGPGHPTGDDENALAEGGVA